VQTKEYGPHDRRAANAQEGWDVSLKVCSSGETGRGKPTSTNDTCGYPLLSEVRNQKCRSASCSGWGDAEGDG
jgi:hypothetical protein